MRMPGKGQAGINAVIAFALLLFVMPRLLRLLGWVGALLALVLVGFLAFNLMAATGWRGLGSSERKCQHCGKGGHTAEDRFCRTCGRPLLSVVAKD